MGTDAFKRVELQPLKVGHPRLCKAGRRCRAWIEQAGSERNAVSALNSVPVAKVATDHMIFKDAGGREVMRAQVKALATVRGEVAWRLIWRLVEVDVKRLTGAERGAYRLLLKRPQKR